MNIPFSNPLHHPKPHAGSFAQSDVVGQGDIGFEVEGEGQHVPAFEGQGFDGFYVGDFNFDGFFHEPAYAFGEGQDVAGEDALEQFDLLSRVFAQGLPAFVVVLVQSKPVEQAVVETVLPNIGIEAVGHQFFNGVLLPVGAHGQLQVRL